MARVNKFCVTCYVSKAPFESLDLTDWNTPESLKRITCIIMIHAGHQNREIAVVAQCTLNTVKTIRQEVEDCDGDYEAVARRKKHNRRSDCVRTAEFL